MKINMIIKKIKGFTIRHLNKLSSVFGFEFRRKNSSNLIVPFYDEFNNHMDLNDEIFSVVFSKDRAMQLEAFLISYFENVLNYSKLKVLYKASNDAHLKSYEELKMMFKNKPVMFVLETEFRSQLNYEISNEFADRVVFYVDDMIFTRSIDYNILKRTNPYKYIVSLTRGRDLTYSSVLLKELKLPTFTKNKNGLLEFSWMEVNEFSDWSYPLGVSGYMYATKEFSAMLRVSSFEAPNSLENSLQEFRTLFNNRIGVCTDQVVAACVHANLVQDEVSNPTLGTFTAEELLAKWKLGLQIDVSCFYNKNVLVAQTQAYKFQERQNAES